MALRMTFGGAPCPSLWGHFSETITDVCNTLIQCSSWDFMSFVDETANKIPDPICLPLDVPFAQAKALAVDIPVNDLGKVDVFIDDNIAITPDLNFNTSRVIRALPLAIHSVARPVEPTDDIPRVDIISTKKLQAEGTFEEVKIVLGWQLNTRSLLISLPRDKHQKWSHDINKMISLRRSSYELLESTIGRLNHTAGILPMLRHFLGRLRHALFRSSNHKWTNFRLCEISDLHICLTMLDHAATGISINNIVFRKPTTFYRSDASEFGLGGYNLISGLAWRFQLPVNLCVITIGVDIINNKIAPEDCILSQSDSTSATGWLRKSNFYDSEDSSIQLVTSRQLATLILNSKSCLYSPWFPGGENLIADSLSRDFHLSDSDLSNFLISSVPHQVPSGLKIKPLPSEISSWLTSLLRNLPEKERWSKEPTRSSLWHGSVTNSTSYPLELQGTGSSTISQETRNIKYWAHSATQSEKADFILNKSGLINQNQLEPPWIMWHRPTSWLEELTQDSIKTGNLHSFYNDNFADTELPMFQNDDK